MDNNKEQLKDESQIQKSINTALRIAFVALLLIMSFLILKPFIAPILWGIIIAIAIFPIHKKLLKLLGNRVKLSAAILVIVGISLIIIPSILFASSTVESMQSISEQFNNGSFSIPPPQKEVAEWPVIGEPIYDTWNLAYNSTSDAIQKFSPQIKTIAPTVFSAAGGLVKTIILFFISVIISGALLVNVEAAEKSAKDIFRTLAGKDGEQFALLAAATTRGVVQGVLGTAVLQTLFIGLGLVVIDFPAAGVITLIILFMAIAQIPIIIVVIPSIVYVFTYADTTAAIIFAVWVIAWSISDSFIKPVLMGRGVDVPMLVILLGAIGGMILGGIIGLFIGAVVLAFSFKVLQAIIQSNTESTEIEEQ